MPLLDNPEFIAGLTTGAIIAATLVIVSAFRQLSLAIAAMAVIYVFATQGVVALADWVKNKRAALGIWSVFQWRRQRRDGGCAPFPDIAGAERT